MSIGHIIPHIEALIFASDKPVTIIEVTDLANSAFGLSEDKITPEQAALAVESLSLKYQSDDFPFEIREIGGGWQFMTKKDFYKTVAQLNSEKFLKRLSAASLETLAIIAYKQPVTKGEIEAIRGVNCDYSIQKLLEKELVVITGRNEALPGKPLVYTTSRSFMDYFGINDAGEMPRINEVLASQQVEPTVVSSQEPVNEDPPPDDLIAPDPPGGDDSEVLLVVRGNGELTEEPDIVVSEDTDAVAPGIFNAAVGDEALEDEVNEEIESRLEEAAGDGHPAPDDQRE